MFSCISRHKFMILLHIEKWVIYQYLSREPSPHTGERSFPKPKPLYDAHRT